MLLICDWHGCIYQGIVCERKQLKHLRFCACVSGTSGRSWWQECAVFAPQLLLYQNHASVLLNGTMPLFKHCSQAVVRASSDFSLQTCRVSVPPAQIEGRGNGIKTNAVNLVDISKALERPPDCAFPTPRNLTHAGDTAPAAVGQGVSYKCCVVLHL